MSVEDRERDRRQDAGEHRDVTVALDAGADDRGPSRAALHPWTEPGNRDP
jgi:hypothetical protein